MIPIPPRPPCPLQRATTIVLMTALAGLVACGDKAAPATQIAAKVNKEEISVHQINFALQQQTGLTPDQAEAAGRQILERLINQEVALQKAQEQKLDRDPRVMQQLEAARREIIARAYIEKLGDAVTKPSAEDIKAYYDAKPALFSQRRIYTLQEVTVEANAQQLAELQARLPSFKSLPELGAYLRQANLPARSAQNTAAAESLPMPLLERLATLREGQTLFVPLPRGARLITMLQARSEPVDEAQARPAIERFLVNESKRKAVDEEMKTIRTAAHVEYVGQFAAAASGPAAAASASQAAAVAAEAPAPGASGLDADAIHKGLSGLK